MSVPGIGLIAAMELLVELQDVSRFRRADELAAYMAGILWVFTCGRNFTPDFPAMSATRWMLLSSLSRSMTSSGVSNRAFFMSSPR
jgi:hypothetical protein